jgi:hypothetical protein
MKKQELVLKILGIFILFYGLLAITQAITSGNPGWIFWTCYLGMILIGIGSLTKNSLLIKIQLNILTIPLILWIIDFFSILIFNYHLLGMTDYFFRQITIFARLVSLEHFFLLPIGFTSLYLTKKLTKSSLEKAWHFSSIQLIILFTLTRLLTSPQDNVNSVFFSRINFIPDSEFYLIYLFILCFIMIILTDFTISKIFKRL